MPDIDVGELSEAINDKMDRDLNNRTDGSGLRKLVESYVNGTSWYKVFDEIQENGTIKKWCEQGGRYTVASSSPHTINLFKTMSDTDYSIMICPAMNNAGDYTVSILVRSDMITTSSFGVQKQWTSSTGYYYWKAKGYIS